jgi:hypothetical protein
MLKDMGKESFLAAPSRTVIANDRASFREALKMTLEQQAFAGKPAFGAGLGFRELIDDAQQAKLMPISPMPKSSL